MVRRTCRTVAVALSLAFALPLWGSISSADEFTSSVEQQAFAIDSASGLSATRQPQKFLGARSCAASACHGGVDPDPRFPLSRRNEYVQWLDKDPHSRSYQTLHNELSKAILERLARASDDDAARAQRLANCFGCHNPQPERSKHEETFYARDAVSCEICHGPAERWIGPHVTDSWPHLKQTGDAAELGFVSTEDITTRAKICAECHVGSPGREVNHDLIAAGHPALKFELTAYYAMLPKHWRDEDERRANPQLEIALWKAGQVACGEAAVELLAWRANRAANEDTDAIWPEFAEYDCYACHHELVHPSWRQTSATSSAPLGMPTWGGWYFSRWKHSSGEGLRALADQMQQGFRSDPKSILEAAKVVQFPPPTIDIAVSEPANWDDATQQYLALVATEQFQRDAGTSSTNEVATAITRLREQLAFPAGHDSPKRLFEPGDRNVTRDDVHQSLLDLMQQLQRRKEN
ncbi:MAG TPA: multiheme c-type cytochrome [Pirellulaceae bacterium]|nr:multiheme c-type cytochrome [Pirellulaceae bacterium]